MRPYSERPLSPQIQAYAIALTTYQWIFPFLRYLTTVLHWLFLAVESFDELSVHCIQQKQQHLAI